jgi:predicted TIM-barrel enzyme
MDVVTTSGKGTGWAADIKKIQKMKQAMGDFPLAIASGVTPENVTTYLPVADCFLVATGISRNFYEFDLAKTRQLINVVRKGH